MALILPGQENDLAPSRRRLLTGGAASLFCAPAIVRAASIMPVKPWRPMLILPRGPSCGPYQEGFIRRLMFDALAHALIDGRPISITLNGKTVSVEHARRTVAYAKQHGFLAPSVAQFIKLV